MEDTFAEIRKMPGGIFVRLMKKTENCSMFFSLEEKRRKTKELKASQLLKRESFWGIQVSSWEWWVASIFFWFHCFLWSNIEA